MRLYICSTYYHVYIVLLKQFADPQASDLVVCDDIPTGKQLTAKLQEAGLFHRVWYVEQSKLPEVRGWNRLDWVLFQHRRRFRIVRPMLPFDLDNYQDIYIFHDGTPLGMYLADAKRPYHLIEDSLNFYQRILDTAQAKHLMPHNLKYQVRRLLKSGYFPLGESHFVVDVEVNENKKLQMRLPNVVELPRNRLERLTQKDQRMLLEAFNCPELAPIGAHSALVLTEPLYSDRLCKDIVEQVSIYQKLVEVLKTDGYSIILKPHPRDQADYTRLGVQMMKREFPVELLGYLPNTSFACAVAVSSSAIFELHAKHKFWWNHNVLQKIVQKDSDADERPV